jgi:hypothetical protein
MREAHRRMLGPVREEGAASEYIGYLPDMIERGEVNAMILHARVSTPVQQRNGSLSDQMKKLKELVKPYGKSPHRIPVVARFCEMGKGKNPSRRKLRRAVAMARREHAVIVVDTTDRLIRAEDYDPHDRDTWKHRPTDAEYRHFMEVNSGVVFATIGRRPDAGPRRTRSHQTKRGQEAKGNKGGRPKKSVKLTPSQRKVLLLPEIKRLRMEKGPGGKPKGYCKIAKEIKAAWRLPLSSRTVMRWLKEDA